MNSWTGDRVCVCVRECVCSNISHGIFFFLPEFALIIIIFIIICTTDCGYVSVNAALNLSMSLFAHILTCYDGLEPEATNEP